MKYPQKVKFIRALFIILVIALIGIFIDLTELSEISERKTIDMRTRVCRSSVPSPSDIVIIMIDEASLNLLNETAGRWPWPRNFHSELIDFLSANNARAIIMDIMFFENEKEPENIDKLGKNDIKLVDSTKASDRVFHAVQIKNMVDEKNKNLIDKPLPLDFTNKFSLDIQEMSEVENHNTYYIPFKPLYEAARGVGVVTFSNDKDGVFRSEKLLFKYQDHYLPSLSFAPIADQFIDAKINLKKRGMDIIGNGYVISIPLTKNSEYYVNLYGSYDIISYSKVYESILQIKQGKPDALPVKPNQIDDKIVFVGASAAATYDLMHTAIETNAPGVLLHASICGNILTNDFLKFTGPYVNFFPILILLTITVFSIFYLKTIYSQILVPLLAILAYYVACVTLFNANIVLNIAIPSLAVLLAYIVSFTVISFTEGREKRKIKNILGQYVSPAMLSTVLDTNKEEYLKAEVGSKEVLTLFFSDIRDFTTISEKYEVEKVVEVLNGYLSEMVNIIFNNEGTLDKFIGDAIVAFWGAPVKIQDHRYKAVISAIQMVNALKGFNEKNRENGLPELKIGIGIHTGEVILGNIGSEKKLDYTVIGDSVNLASRLEGLSKYYKCSIIISQDTYEEIQEKIYCRIVDFVKAKGKEKPIMIYEVLGDKSTMKKEDLSIVELTERAFTQYREKQFSESIDSSKKILDILPDDHIANMFIERCKAYLKENPSDGWDGSYSHESK